jgi:predicted ATP-dependent endonuclease of OLD family
MDHLDYISINNYRAIKSNVIIPKSINVFVGRNNCGKSSILEAIALNLSAPNDFKDLIGNNIWYDLVRLKRYDPSYLIHNDLKKVNIDCKTKDSNNRLEIEIVEEGYPSDKRGKLIQNYFQIQIEEFFQKSSTISEMKEAYCAIPRKILSPANKQKTLFDITENFYDDTDNQQFNDTYDTLKESFNNFLHQLKENLILDVLKQKKVVFSYYVNDNLKYLAISFQKPPVFGPISDRYRTLPDSFNRRFYAEMLSVRVPNSMRVIPVFGFSESIQNKIIVNLDHTVSLVELSGLHDQIVSNNKIDQTIQNLKDKIDYFQDIRKTDQGLQVFLKTQVKPLPISSMGDGFNALLKLTFMNDLLEKGIIILEEPESSLHPGFLFILCEAILNNSKDSQFFISTHSVDFIQTLLKVADWTNKLDTIQIIRMHPRPDIQDSDIETITGETAKEEIEEIGRDLRGI